MSDQKERWLPVIGYEDQYEISDRGRVFSLYRGIVRKPHMVGGGYAQILLWHSGKQKQKQHRIHRLVLEAFVGPCPDGMECCHNDGSRTNNGLENLRWGTAKENQADRLNHGTDNCGEKHGNAKLTVDKVSQIRKLSEFGVSQRVIAEKFGITQPQVSRIANGRSWSHVA